MLKRAEIIWLSLVLMTAAAAPLGAQAAVTEVVKQVKPAVVTINVYDAAGKPLAQGSGFFIDSLHVITSWHVIQRAGRAEVKTMTGKVYQVKGIAAEDRAADIVSLVLSEPNTSVKPLRVAGTLPQAGERVVVIGSPEGVEYVVSDGIVSGLRNLPETGRVIVISAPISEGSSGSPVVNLKGEVVGVAVASHRLGQNLNFAVPSERILALKPHAATPLPGAAPGGLGRGPSTGVQEPYQVGLGLFRSENYVEALSHFKEAVRRNPQDYMSWFFQGLCYIELDRYDQAVPALKQAVTINPGFAFGYFGLGLAYTGLGSYDAAISAYKAGISLEPAEPIAHFGLGLAYLGAGDKASALQEYAILQTLDPDLANRLFALIYR